MSEDLLEYSEPHLLRQIEDAPFQNGYFTLRFYEDRAKKPSPVRTGSVGTYYYYPSGGTLRDSEHHLVWYEAKFDTYRGFRPPGGPWKDDPDAPNDRRSRSGG